MALVEAASRVGHKLTPRNLYPSAPRVPATATAPSGKCWESCGPLTYDDRTLRGRLFCAGARGGLRPQPAPLLEEGVACAGGAGAGAVDQQAEALTTARAPASLLSRSRDDSRLLGPAVHHGPAAASRWGARERGSSGPLAQRGGRGVSQGRCPPALRLSPGCGKLSQDSVAFNRTQRQLLSGPGSRGRNAFLPLVRGHCCVRGGRGPSSKCSPEGHEENTPLSLPTQGCSGESVASRWARSPAV